MWNRRFVRHPRALAAASAASLILSFSACGSEEPPEKGRDLSTSVELCGVGPCLQHKSCTSWETEGDWLGAPSLQGNLFFSVVNVQARA